MLNEKMTATIENKLCVKVVKVYEVKKISENVAEVHIGIGGFDGMVVTLRELRNQYGSYYKVLKAQDVLLTGKRAEEIVEEKSKQEKKSKLEMDEKDMMASLEVALKLSESMKTSIFVMSNSKRAVVIKTKSNKARHEKYGYLVVAIFDNGVQVPA